MGERLETNDDVLKEIEKLLQGISPAPRRRPCRYQAYSMVQIRYVLKMRYINEEQIIPDVLEPPE